MFSIPIMSILFLLLPMPTLFVYLPMVRILTNADFVRIITNGSHTFQCRLCSHTFDCHEGICKGCTTLKILRSNHKITLEDVVHDMNEVKNRNSIYQYSIRY